MIVTACVGAYVHFIYLPAHSPAPEFVYPLGKSVDVSGSAAEVRSTIAILKPGHRAEVLARTQNWMKIRLENGQVGWVEAREMLESVAYEAGRRLFESLEKTPAQAAGHSSYLVNLRLGPSRAAFAIGQLEAQERVEIFGRRVADLPSETEGAGVASGGDNLAAGPSRREAWYVVRSGSKAGWVLGRLIDLDIPASIANYAQGTNLVAWIVLNTVDDNGQKKPQYLVADRRGTQEADFNHIRVLTWWPKGHHYVVAYVESNLSGQFPIQVGRIDGSPTFRLRLLGGRGNRFQKVYELSGTITRPLGTVDGWESDALPPLGAPRHRGSGGQGRAAGRGFDH